MLIDGYMAEQMKKIMLNSEQEQVKVYDAYYNKGVTDGYNQALEDFKTELIKIYNKRYMHDIYLDDIKDIIERLSR